MFAKLKNNYEKPVLILAAMLFVFLFSFTKTPLLAQRQGYDSFYFITTGRQIINGGVPYLDFFDMKSPLVFFINALGLLIHDGRLGIFIVQCIFLAATFLLMHATARLFLGRGAAFFAVLAVLPFLAAVYDGGNLTEEYSLPFFIYFDSHNALGEMLKGTFILPLKYADNSLAIRTTAQWKLLFRLLTPLAAAVTAAVAYKNRNKSVALLVLLAALVTMFAFSIGRVYRHYYIMAIPVFFVALVLFLDLLKERQLNLRSRVAVKAAACLMLFLTLHYYIPLVEDAAKTTVTEYRETALAQQENSVMLAQLALIPMEERGSVWGYDVPMQWFSITKVSPCYKYTAFQTSFSRLLPSIKEEINEMLATRPPLWVVIVPESLTFNQTLYGLLQNDYELKAEGAGVLLYRRAV